MRAGALLALALVWSLGSYAGGGDIFGNGGGVAESNFVHAYSRLYKLIDNCLNSKFCTKTEGEFYDLLSIREATAKNYKTVSRLVYSTPEKHPEIFFTHDSDVVRLAVTGTNLTDPIYVNLDMLYKKIDGKNFPALSYGQIVEILIHEVGHNVGLLDHSYLNYLGSLVRDFTEERLLSENYVLNDQVFSVNLINFVEKMKLSEFWVNWNDKTLNITSEVYMMSECRDGSKPFSIKFKNYHQEKIQKNDGKSIIPVNTWAELICNEGPIETTEIIDVYVFLTSETKSNKLSVEIKINKL